MTYAYMMPYGLFFMAVISSYSCSVAVATSLAQLPLYQQITSFNELMITSRPKVAVILLSRDSLIIS